MPCARVRQLRAVASAVVMTIASTPTASNMAAIQCAAWRNELKAPACISAPPVYETKSKWVFPIDGPTGPLNNGKTRGGDTFAAGAILKRSAWFSPGSFWTDRSPSDCSRTALLGSRTSPPFVCEAIAKFAAAVTARIALINILPDPRKPERGLNE